MSAARKRTAGQTGTSKRDQDAQIQDEQEQENEIKSARKKHEQDKLSAQRTMDMGVVVAVLMNLTCIFRYMRYGLTLALVLVISQTVILPLSLTPKWISPLKKHLNNHHLYVVCVQLGIVMAAIWLLLQNEVWGYYDIAQLSLPLTVAAGVEIQRRSDQEMDLQMKRWERTRYNVKGA